MNIPEQGQVTWESPSNIALVKYWGKREGQFPLNSSVSLTLDKCRTVTTLRWQRKSKASLEYYFEQDRHAGFEDRVRRYFLSLQEELPFLADFAFRIYSENTFPHSVGIASSASAMSALALCLVSLEQKIDSRLDERSAFLQRASELARLGSGSACRSVFAGAALWGKSDRWAVGLEDLHPVFRSWRDSILIVSSSPKEVSSSDGHLAMREHPYGQRRFELACKRADLAVDCLRSGRQEELGELVEQEALELHMLMATAKVSSILLKPQGLEIIQKVRAFRRDSGTAVYFSLDAGTCVHLLYPACVQEQVRGFIRRDLAPLLENGKCLHDQVGPGPFRRER